MRAWLVPCRCVERWDTAGLDDERGGGGVKGGSKVKLCGGDKSQAHRRRWSREVCRPTGKGLVGSALARVAEYAVVQVGMGGVGGHT